jgi:hypothetical protein
VTPVPSSLDRGRQLLFWITLAYWSFVPGSSVPWVQLAQIPVSTYDILLALVACCFTLTWLLTPRPMVDSGREKQLALWVASLIGYALLSCCWNGLKDLDHTAMTINAGISFCTLMFAFFVISPLSAAALPSFLFQLVGFISVVGLVYSAESFLGLGFRSELGQFYNTFGFGIDRVHGPLFASSRGQFILIPALAFVIEGFLRERGNRLWTGLQILGLTITLLGLGSRAAILLLALLALTVAVLARRQWLAVVALLPIGYLGWVLVFSQASGDRLRSFEDSTRLQTHRTAWDMLRNRDFSENIVGSGYGSIWPWYMEDALEGDRIAKGRDLRTIERGQVLFEAHSLPLILLIELGVVGGIFLLRLTKDLVALVIDGIRSGNYAVFAAGVAISALSGFGETLIFKDAKVSGIWLLFVFAAMRLTHCKKAISMTSRVPGPVRVPAFGVQEGRPV